MDRSKVRLMQDVQLKIMDKFHAICLDNNLTYYIVGGTLLGAVRHKGFIPWDADMDIAMPRKDYDLFVHQFSNELESECKCLSHENYANFTKPHAIIIMNGTKLHIGYEKLNPEFRIPGIYIELFPLDKIPIGKYNAKRQELTIRLINKIIYYKASLIFDSNKKLIISLKKIFRIILKPISFKFLGNLLQSSMTKYNNSKKSNPDVICSMAGAYGYNKETVECTLYGTPRLMEFEGRYYFAPEQAEKFLSHYYNNYMKLPSIEEQERMYNYFDSVDIQIDTNV